MAVMNAGTIVYGRGYGSADIERGTPFTTASAFDAASMAKQFLAFSLALLVQEGRLSWDDPVQKHLPELPDYGAPVTLRHLVHHTSGLRDAEVHWFSGGRVRDPAMLPGLTFAPGTGHMYDDTGYDLLGRVLERVTGEPGWAFARRRIFDPLGMTHTGSPHAERGLPARVRAYAERRGGGYEMAEGERHGGFTSTPEDLARWDRNFYDARVGGPEVVRAMGEEGRLNDGETVPYGLALHTEPYRGLRRQWHGGLSAGYRSQFMRYPDQRTSVLVMCNVYQVAEPNSLAERVTDAVLADAIAAAGAREESTVAPPPAAELARLAGTYVNPAEQTLRPVRVHEGRLQVRQWITWHETRPLGGGRFRVEGQPLTVVFGRGAEGRPTLEERWDGRRTPVRLALPAEVRVTAAELDRLAGSYRSAELGLAVRLARRGDGLAVSGGPRGGLRMRPAGRDVFTDEQYVLFLFRRDGEGRIAGFTLATPRLRRVEFARVRG
jgi:CubicO group peptidase (beta-lactamase class C family)